MKQTKEEYIFTQMYELKQEIEELKFIQPKLLKIVDFYFERYGFGIKISKPDRYVFLEKYYSQLLRRLSDLEFKLKFMNLNYDMYGKKILKGEKNE